MYYLELFDQLNKDGVRYLVVGGLAVVLHGFLRFTADIDLFIDLQKENVDNLLAALKNLGYTPLPPVDPAGLADQATRQSWIREKGLKVFSFVNSRTGKNYQTIDVFIEEPLPFAATYSRRQTRLAGRTEVSIISLRDLIELKKISAREQDLLDIQMLEKLADEKEL